MQSGTDCASEKGRHSSFYKNKILNLVSNTSLKNYISDFMFLTYKNKIMVYGEYDTSFGISIASILLADKRVCF